MGYFHRVAQVVGRSGIAASLPDRGDIDGVDCKDPVTSAKRIYDLLCNGIGLQHGTASDSDGDRCDLVRAFAVICVGLSFLFFIRLLLFRKKEFKEEMYKKFHV